jgi:hypothetical protein
LQLPEARLVSGFAPAPAFESKSPGAEQLKKRMSKIDSLPGDSPSTNLGFTHRISKFRAEQSPLSLHVSKAAGPGQAKCSKNPGLEISAETPIKAAVDTSNLEQSHRIETLGEDNDLGATTDAFEQFLLRESRSLRSKPNLDCLLGLAGQSRQRSTDHLSYFGKRAKAVPADLPSVDKIRNGFLKNFVIQNFSSKNFPRLKTFENFVYASPERHEAQLSQNLRSFRDGLQAPTMTVSDMLSENERILLSRMSHFYRDRSKLSAYAVHSDKTVNLKLDKSTRLSHAPLSEKIRIRMRFDEVSAVRKVLVLKQSKSRDRRAPLKQVSFSGPREPPTPGLRDQASRIRFGSKNISRLSSKEKFSSTPNLLRNQSELSEQSKLSKASYLHRKKYLASLTTTLRHDTSASGPLTAPSFVQQSATKLQHIIAQASHLHRITKLEGSRLVSLTTKFLARGPNPTGPSASRKALKAKAIKEHLGHKFNKTSDFS